MALKTAEMCFLLEIQGYYELYSVRKYYTGAVSRRVCDHTLPLRGGQDGSCVS